MKFQKVFCFLLILFACFAPLREILAQTPESSGDVEKIKYKQFFGDSLETSKLENFDINKSSGAFLLANEKEEIAASRWILPKRTRSYPLTSMQLNGSINSDAKDEDLDKFCPDNLIDAANEFFLKKLFQEARENKFTIILEHAETAK